MSNRPSNQRLAGDARGIAAVVDKVPALGEHAAYLRSASAYLRQCADEIERLSEKLRYVCGELQKITGDKEGSPIEAYARSAVKIHERLRASLSHYGDHANDCNLGTIVCGSVCQQCTCGFTALLAEQPVEIETIVDRYIIGLLLTASFHNDESGGYFAVSPTALDRVAESIGRPKPSRVMGNYGRLADESVTGADHG